MTNLRNLLQNIDEKKSVIVELTLDDVQRYLQSEKDPQLIFQWAKAYLEITLET